MGSAGPMTNQIVAFEGSHKTGFGHQGGYVSSVWLALQWIKDLVYVATQTVDRNQLRVFQKLLKLPILRKS